jgi:hypothetical protein
MASEGQTTMLDAILKGKISRHTDHKEDLLTSVVFGVLKHLPPVIGIHPLLALARRRENKSIPADLLHPSRIRIEFWPRWNEAEAEIKHGAEPDAVLWCEYPKGLRRAFIIEAKRDNGKHGEGEFDQLARQVANGKIVVARSDYELAGLLYVTADIALPERDLADSEAILDKVFDLDNVPLWWVSWRDLGPVFDAAAVQMYPPMGDLSRDVARCLRKWGLDRFRGITVTIKPTPEYRFRQTFSWPVTGVVPLWRFEESKP